MTTTADDDLLFNNPGGSIVVDLVRLPTLQAWQEQMAALQVRFRPQAGFRLHPGVLPLRAQLEVLEAAPLDEAAKLTARGTLEVDCTLQIATERAVTYWDDGDSEERAMLRRTRFSVTFCIPEGAGDLLPMLLAIGLGGTGDSVVYHCGFAQSVIGYDSGPGAPRLWAMLRWYEARDNLEEQDDSPRFPDCAVPVVAERVVQFVQKRLAQSVLREGLERALNRTIDSKRVHVEVSDGDRFEEWTRVLYAVVQIWLSGTLAEPREIEPQLWAALQREVTDAFRIGKRGASPL